MKIIFVDLDETLVQTECSYHNKRRTKIQFEDQGDTHTYGCAYKKGSRELLAELRSKYGRVYMLTAAMLVYARAINQALDLGFKDGEIIARDELNNGIDVGIGTDNVSSVLIDNQYPDEYNATLKISYLKNFGSCGYVRMKRFSGNKEQQFSAEDISNITAKIDEQFTLIGTEV